MPLTRVSAFSNIRSQSTRTVGYPGPHADRARPVFRQTRARPRPDRHRAQVAAGEGARRVRRIAEATASLRRRCPLAQLARLRVVDARFKIGRAENRTRRRKFNWQAWLALIGAILVAVSAFLCDTKDASQALGACAAVLALGHSPGSARGRLKRPS